jgi:hemerythrin-like domain-containing protein
MTRADRHRTPTETPIVEAMPYALLEEPLDYIFADHFRQRSVCVALKRFAASGRAPRREADMVIAFLDRDLRWHHEDEDEDLFPAVRRRTVAEDDLGAVLARLTEDHRQSELMVSAIVSALAARPDQDPVRLDQQSREMMQVYAASEHRHLALENGIVLSIARIRLKPADLNGIRAAMKKRRGLADVAHA